MVVKSKRGRRRYVVFSTSVSLTKEDLIRKLRSSCGENAPYVIQHANGKTVIRCSPTEIDDISAKLRSVDDTSESLITSGTLKTIRERYPELRSQKKH